MPRKPSPPESQNRAERDLTEALERIQKGAPKNPRLKALAIKGALRLTVSSVALEAGRSRTLIGTEDCAYPAIRARIVDAEKPSGQVRTQDEIIANLRKENKAIRAEKAQIATQLADAVAAAWRLKKELDFLKAVKKQAGSNVVPFERPN